MLTGWRLCFWKVYVQRRGSTCLYGLIPGWSGVRSMSLKFLASPTLAAEFQIEDQVPLEVVPIGGEAGDAPKIISRIVWNSRRFICWALVVSWPQWKPEQHLYSLMIFFCYLCDVGCYFCFIFHSISWVLSHFFLVSLDKCLSILSLKRKKKQLSFMGLPYCFLGIYFIYFFSDVYDFLPSSGFGFCLFFFSLIPSCVRWSCLFEVSLEEGVYCYKSPS